MIGIDTQETIAKMSVNSTAISLVSASKGSLWEWLRLTIELITFILTLIMACFTTIQAQASPIQLTLWERSSAEVMPNVPRQGELPTSSLGVHDSQNIELTARSGVEQEIFTEAFPASSSILQLETPTDLPFSQTPYHPRHFDAVNDGEQNPSQPLSWEQSSESSQVLLTELNVEETKTVDLKSSEPQMEEYDKTLTMSSDPLELSSGKTPVKTFPEEVLAEDKTDAKVSGKVSFQSILEEETRLGGEFINGRVDLVQKWHQKKSVQSSSPVSTEQTPPRSSWSQSSPKGSEQINGRVDLIAQWFKAQANPKEDSWSFSQTLESLLESPFLLDLENLTFGEPVQSSTMFSSPSTLKSSPSVSSQPQLLLPTSPAVPRLNPTQPGNIVPRDGRPLDTGTNAHELLNLVEDVPNSSVPQPPSYVPVIPLEQPQPLSSPPKESSVSPLPPNVPKEVGWQILDIIIENLINDAAGKYPFLVNTSDLLTINPNGFNPQKANTYLSVNLDLDDFSSINPTSKEAFSDPILSNLTMSGYPDEQQFYWILPGNRVVIETQGGHFNTGYQGQDFSRFFLQRATARFGLFGQQAVFAIPQPLSSLIGTEKEEGLQILTGVAEISLPPGIDLQTVPAVRFNLLNIDGQGTNVTKIVRVDNINKATTNDKEGGGSSFVNLDASNAPRFIQAFPTINLQPFLANGLQWRRGEVVSIEDLASIGITVGEPLSGQGFRFDLPLSSKPGIKTLQLNATDNNDLVRLLSNPFLSDRQRDFYYLNSLMWYSGGQGPATIENIELNQGSKDWYRSTVSWSHNRSLLTYDPENIELNYTNVFSNPGISLTYSDFDNTDNKQTLSASFGLLLGGVFAWIAPDDLKTSLDEAHGNYEQVKSLDTLKTKATSQQRRSMNFRLNRTLQNTSSNSALSQVSGSYTFYGNVTPDNSLVLQIRSGIYARAANFYEQTVSDWTNPPWRISSVRPSDFGPLVFTGVNVPIDSTNINYNPVFTLGFAMATDQTGQVILDQTITLDRYSLTAVPFIGGRAVDIDFGRINFIRILERQINTQNYQGYLYFPSLELLLSGTVDDVSYSVSLGGWYNFYPQSAPSIENNQPTSNGSISSENSLGFFLKGLLKADINNIFYDDQNQWDTILTHTPALSLNATTDPNRLNIASLSLSYTLQLLRRNYGGSLTFSTSYSPQGLNAAFENNSLGKIGLFTALNFYHQVGLRFYGSLSLGDTNFYYVESTYDILRNEQWGTVSIGPYASNYVTATRGFNSQIQDNNYGGIFVYTLPNSGLSLRARLGTGETGFRGEINLNGQIKF